MNNEIKPKLRDADQRSISYTLAKAIKEAFTSNEFPFQNCITCTHFSEKGYPANANGPASEAETCRLYKMRPPARVIAYGCPSYVDFDIIPF